jgi:ribose 5-phosphate isomerase A
VIEDLSLAREAAAAAAVKLVEPGMLLGLGSGRAVWRVVDLIGEAGLDVRAAVASERTDACAREAGIEVVPLDGAAPLDLALDGADEIDRELRLIKGGGGALLREKVVVAAASRFVVVAETPKLVERLGAAGGFRLPVEVARFGWRSTQRRLADLLPDSALRVRDDDDAYVTDEGHFILDSVIPADADLDALGPALSVVPGVMEHGLFIGLAERALLGTPEGEVRVVG